ncbi:MAG: 1-acyl-sn-glycerol-3-phosphate acyltransferase [Sulfobacillus thermosulfidooxidans]|nr:lysophospholipid acyltransferase family protein [Sulfobacillus sp. hq2]MCY0907266.1 lysophospholipid acyltransferase family protein [Sulfobacillus thermotolerans]POB10896.1 1-acyl-sn-glycerol-3-phosphate acyltransferase [Sulfobacillus sp. hq2]PSR37080.1 MAG: 1-acyl-sn-glycerol-3-phosphate acyltransferase [Sulfobacillus thermosulfidooxidans]
MIYGFFYWLVRILMSLYFRIEVSGLEHVPKRGSVLILVNHITFLDPPMAAILMPRPVYFMAKAELFSVPVFGWLIRRLHAFPVHRGKADRKAIRTSLQLLARDQALMIFPEGHRSHQGPLQEARAGAVYLAQKTGCPCLPIGISGQYGFRKTIRYSIGELFTIPPEMERHDAQKMIMEKIAEQIEAPAHQESLPKKV